MHQQHTVAHAEHTASEIANEAYWDATDSFESVHEILQEEARVLHEQSVGWFADGFQEEGRALYAQAQRASREAEEAEREHHRSKRERASDVLRSCMSMASAPLVWLFRLSRAASVCCHVGWARCSVVPKNAVLGMSFLRLCVSL